MVTGFETDNQRAMFSIAMSLRDIAKELKRLNDKLDKMSYNESALCTMDVSKL